MLNFSVYTLSLPRLTPREGAALISSLGFRGVEWRYSEQRDQYALEEPSFTRNNRCTVDPHHDSPSDIRRICESNSLESVGLAPYIVVGDLEGFRRAAVYALQIGAGFVRLRAPTVDDRPFQELFAEGRDFFREVETISRETGVRGLLEIHQRSLCASAAMAERLMAGLDPRHVGVIYDVGNLVLEGYEDPRVGLAVLGPYLAHVHIKNAAWRKAPGTRGWEPYWTALDDGMVDMRAFLRLLETNGYQGWVSLEDLTPGREGAETLARNADLLKEWDLMPQSQHSHTT